MFRKALVLNWTNYLTEEMGLSKHKEHFSIIVYGKTSRGISTGMSDADMKFFFKALFDESIDLEHKLKNLLRALGAGVVQSRLFPKGIDTTSALMDTSAVEEDLRSNAFYGQLFLDGKHISGNIEIIRDLYEKIPEYSHREEIRGMIVKFWKDEMMGDYLIDNEFKLYQRLFDIFNHHLQLNTFSEQITQEEKLKNHCIFNSNMDFYRFSNHIGLHQEDFDFYNLLKVMFTLRHLFFLIFEKELTVFDREIIKKTIEKAYQNKDHWVLLQESTNELLGKTQCDHLEFKMLIDKIKETVEKLIVKLNLYGAEIRPEIFLGGL